jgi:hypothetical protein
MTKFVSFLSILFALVSVPLNANAQTSQTNYVVIAKAGLNVRDANCNVMRVMPYGDIVYIATNQTITCKVNGVNVKMINIDQFFGENTTGQFVAESMIKPVLSGNFSIDNRTTLNVNAVGGLNIRNQDCKIIGAVANNTNIAIPIEGVGGSVHVCERDGKFYDMTYVMHKGQLAYAASYYLK